MPVLQQRRLLPKKNVGRKLIFFHFVRRIFISNSSLITEMDSKQKENSNFKFESERTIKNSDIDARVDEILSILDLQVQVPEGLVEKALNRKNEFKKHSTAKIDLSKYLQIAVVLAAAILIGIVMGRNANGSLLLSKKNQQKKALIELRDQYHISDFNAFGEF